MEYLQIINTPDNELGINRPLVRLFTEELIQRGMDVSIAEGVSGGSLIDAITIPGSTRIIHMGGVFYSTQSKIDLGASEQTIRRFGEYSSETAVEMAKAMLDKSGAGLSIATVGRLGNGSRRYVSVAYASRGKNPWVKTMFLTKECGSRRLAKIEITQSVLSQGLHYLRGDESAFRVDAPAFRFRNLIPVNDEVRMVDALAQEVIVMTRNRGITIATIESCTAGAIANALTSIPGSSRVFDRGWLAYDENVKASLGVPPLAMVNGNVYSLKVACAMAEAVQVNTGADIVIATTGTMETIDTRPLHGDTLPGTIYTAVVVRGYKPFLKKILVSCPLGVAREQLKVEVVARVLIFVRSLVENLSQEQPLKLVEFLGTSDAQYNLGIEL